MNQKTTQADQSKVETSKSGGCCGGHKASGASDVRPDPQASIEAPVAKSGGCCCNKTN
ncbi:MAG: hypothetical protein PF480_11505 [Roseovarius sp.]|nr:hypothetical protein [Roseovarius sp.]